MDFEIRELDTVTSDHAFEIRATTLENIFIGAGTAMMEVMIDLENVEGKEEWQLNLSNDDVEMLLHEFLDEIIYLKDVESALFCKFDINMKESDGIIQLSCNLKGDHIKNITKGLKVDVKAVTFHDFILKEFSDGWFCKVVLDL